MCDFITRHGRKQKHHRQIERSQKKNLTTERTIYDDWRDYFECQFTTKLVFLLN